MKKFAKIRSIFCFGMIIASLASRGPGQTIGQIPENKPATAAASLNELKKALDSIANGFGGKLGYSFHHLKTGETLSHRGDELFPTASTIKLAMLCAAIDLHQRGQLNYYERIALAKTDFEGGTGFMKFYRENASPTLKEALHLMITASDNVATNAVGRRIGMKAVNHWLEANGFKSTRLLVPWPNVREGLEKDNDLRKQVDQWGMGVTTPNEMTRMLQVIYNGTACSPAGCDEILRILNHQYFDEGIASQIPPFVAVASKSGIMKHSRSDVALVHSPSGSYVLAVYTNDAKDIGIGWDNENAKAIRAVSAAVWRHYHPNSGWAPPNGYEKFSSGPDW